MHAIGLAVDDQDIGVMDQAIDDGDHARGVGEDGAPLDEGAVSGQDDGLADVALVDEVEEQVSMTVTVGEIAQLVDHEEVGTGVMAQATAQGAVTLLRGEITQHVCGGGKQDTVASEKRLMGDILGDHGLANAIGADQNEVGGILEELQRQPLRDGVPIAGLRPGPVEVSQGFEVAEPGGLEATLQPALAAFGLLFPLNPGCAQAQFGDVVSALTLKSWLVSRLSHQHPFS